jgi:acetylglutamate kinase
MLKRLNIQSRFVDGLRVTDAAAMEVVEMVLSGSINKQIVAAINAAGGKAVGISGKDDNLLHAKKTEMTKDGERVDLGLVGEPDKVNPSIIRSLEQAGVIPVIAPVGFGPDGQTYNINADTAAGAIAPPHADRRAGCPRQVRPADAAAHRRRSAGSGRRRHHLGRHDPQA